MIVRPAKCLRGEVSLPGDKSISHRAAMIAAIAEGESRIDNFATSADCASTLACLRQLGVEIRRQGTTVWIKGVGLRGLQAPTGPLDCGNSGTTMRLMAGILAGQEFDSILTGDESLRRRPMQRIAEPLNAMGGSVQTTDGKPPVRISGRRLQGIDYELPVASAQIKSCVLLAGLYADGETVVVELDPTRDHTERMLRKSGVPVKSERLDGTRLMHRINNGLILRAQELNVPGDISAAAFFMIGAACLDGSDITMKNVGRGAGRTAILDLLKQAGARLQVDRHRETSRAADGPIHEAVADLAVRGGLEQNDERAFGSLKTGNAASGSLRIDRLRIPALIDEVPVVAILGTQLESGMEIRDAAELRVKETDRIAAVVENLRRMNADVEEFDDGFRVGLSRLKGARVDSFGDHRIAMAFTIAGLLAEGETEIVGAECAAVSFPDFFDQLENVAIYE